MHDIQRRNPTRIATACHLVTGCPKDLGAAGRASARVDFALVQCLDRVCGHIFFAARNFLTARSYQAERQSSLRSSAPLRWKAGEG